ncbi:tRNA pseudouridine synthase [Candidatus Methanomassiliicoccus intestinalis]|jgi:tRNA pseudouridine synthase D (truD)|uniref:Probable tRNA pseudouridine synthase D n=1 Tax=Methanomassiliicoccus intestinalis (strain Issoire-Mx1) TaxID=1295009 RepID=R9T8C4_METII|nr:tRNA pseudouridine(13) synthase TruD [Candidatus Methanomassiliicoccus intestinalis]AGN25911.1 tRNA pseudouridine synthase D [Candidatus Methanomassiliicoccus intestinalis Issoire-Mx1]TQS83325.1 MAG: tRNA pseudouridine synthase [Candidatus Methanomassiliicoccus intestinalis]
MQECRGAEAEIGLEVFFTDSPGIGGRLKQTPEDFIVDEISLPPAEDDSGSYSIAKVTSQNWETNRLVRELSKTLRISRDRIGFAGTKDKRGITSQLMSFQASVDDVRNLNLHQISISDVYRSKKPLTIGDLIGNKFIIKCRNSALSKDEIQASISQTESQLSELGGFPNFFGVQRFGAVRPVTHLVGKWIAKGDLEKAVMTYVANPMPSEGGDTREARAQLELDGDFERALEYYPKTLTFERMMIGYLVRNPGDYAGSIEILPPNLQMMFIHAYQSYLFNKMLSERIRLDLPLNKPVIGDVVLPVDRSGLPDHDHGVPTTENNIDLVERQVKKGKAFISSVLFGTDSTFSEGTPGEIERKIIEEEKLSSSDFMIPLIHQCSSKGSRREILGTISDMESRVLDDCTLFSFSLNKGCYATVVLREFMKNGTLMDYS